MNLDEFVNQNNGKQIEVHGSDNAFNQCVDLVNAYIRDVLKLPILKWINAKDFPTKIGSNYEYISNGLLNKPQKGDIIVWSGNIGGGAGHIAIVLSAGVMKFTSFDQNWSTKERSGIENHTYKNVIGWLRPAKAGTSPDWLIQNSDNWIGILTTLGITKKSPTLDDTKRVVAGLKSRATAMDKKAGKLQAEKEALESTIITLNERVIELEENKKGDGSNLKTIDRKLKEAQGKIEGMIEDKKKISITLANLKAKRDYDELLGVDIRKDKFALIKYK